MSSCNYSDWSNYYDRLTQNISYHSLSKNLDRLIKQHVSLKDNNILLDLGCGTGSLLFLLEDMGYDVIGVDNSYSMLSIALSKKQARNSSAALLCQEMDELDLFGTIKVAVSTLDSLNHITDIKLLDDTFKRVSLFLEHGGVFIFDVNTVYKHESILSGSTFVYDYDDLYCVWQNSKSDNEHIVTIDLDIFSLDEQSGMFDRFEEQFCERAYTKDEIEKSVIAAGLSIVEVFDGDFIFEEGGMPIKPHEHSQRLLYIVSKR